MKLLIITQKVNKDDPILGFFHRWIIEFAKNVELLTVICLEEGVHDVPTNVRVLSLGKEKGVSKLGQLLNLYQYVWRYRNEYTHVFVHMNPIYVVLCWKLWFVLGKKVFLWYTHKQVDWKLRMASWFVCAIFTASEESLRLKTKKKVVTGHGIDTDFFSPNEQVVREPGLVLTLGRISPTKQVDDIVRAIASLPDARLEIVGDAITQSDAVYMESCKKLAQDLDCVDRVVWCGAVSHTETRDFYRRASVFVNLSNTGSLDKVLLEALACDTLVISSNGVARTIPVITYTSIDELHVMLDQTLRQPVPNTEANRQFVVTEHGLPRCVELLVATMYA